MKIPPLTDIRELVAASAEIEKSEKGNILPDRKSYFASATTLLGLNDGENASTGHGYLDIIDFIIQNCTNVEDNLQELYRRVAFNFCIGNSDNHFRNHGFLLTAKGWILSPAYDMNPTLNEYQSLLISSTSNKADLSILLDACEDYMLNRTVAEKVVSEVVEAVKGWREFGYTIEYFQKRNRYVCWSVLYTHLLNRT